MSFKKSLLKNIFVAGGYNYLSQAVTFFSSVIISRILTPANFGFINLITVFTGFIMVFSDGGISYALIRSDLGSTYQKVLSNLSWILGIILFVITLVAAYPISLFYNNSQLVLPTIVLGFTFIIKSFSLTQGALLAKRLDFGYIGQITLLCTVVTVVLTIALAYLGATYWSLIFPQIISAAICAFFYERKVKLGFKLYPLNYLVVGFKYTKSLIGNIIGFNIVNYWARNADNLIVGKWYGTSSLGIYNRAYNLLTLPLTLITGLFSNVLFPSLKKLLEDDGDIEKGYYFALKIITFLTYPFVSILILFPNQLVLLLWGKNWINVAELLPYFGLLIFTQTLLSTVGQLLVLRKKEKEFMISGWVGAAFMLIGIISGAFISLKGIAQLYSLAYILFVLTFNIFYLYIRTLKFNTAETLIFWLPKLFFSVALWLTVVYNLSMFKMILLALMLLYILFISRTELKTLVSKVNNKYLSKSN
jgi:teichuronic acid exporter